MQKDSRLSKMVKAILNCFHNLQMEGTFNIVSDVDKKVRENTNRDILFTPNCTAQNYEQKAVYCRILKKKKNSMKQYI